MGFYVARRALSPDSSDYKKGLHRGHPSGLMGVDADLVAANIKYGVTLFGILGTMVQWVFQQKESLTVPMPSVSATAVQASVGGFTAEPEIEVPLPTAAATTMLSNPLAVDGGVAHDDAPPSDTDETTESNNATVNDMHLLPSPGAVGDGFYLGLSTPFDWACINIGTAGAGTWTITWKYWNGTTWTALTIKYDDTANLRTIGKVRVHFSRPGDWALTTIAGIADKYWIKAEIIAYTSMTTQPLGTQAWLGQY